MLQSCNQKTLSVTHKQCSNGLSQTFFKCCISGKKSAHWSLTMFWPRHLTIQKPNCPSQNIIKMSSHKLKVYLIFHNVQPFWSLKKHNTAHKTGPSASHKENDQLVSHNPMNSWWLTKFSNLEKFPNLEKINFLK